MFSYNAQAHIENGHHQNSLLNVYSFDGEYLGHRDDLTLVDGHYFDALEAEGHYCAYNASDATTTVWLNGEIVATYQAVYSQNQVNLGHREI